MQHIDVLGKNLSRLRRNTAEARDPIDAGRDERQSINDQLRVPHP
jgi:hypothetical protein